MKKQDFKIGQFVRLLGNHERAGECGYIEEVSTATARFRFHHDGVETVQPIKNFSTDTLLMWGGGL